MGTVTITGPVMGESLQDILLAGDIVPGDEPSYQLCKQIYLHHVLGAKMAEAPIAMAQSQPRDIAVPEGPEDRLKEAFEREWRAIGSDDKIFNVALLSRVYGAASVALLTEGEQAGDPVDFETLWKATISFNVLDPLNTAGSLVLNQQPNAMDFLKENGISVNGVGYHRSRTCTKFNEKPVYLGYTSSAFGYVGRSVYQRALYPLKSFIETMRTDAFIARKAGVLVAMMKQAGSIIDAAMQLLFARKRQVVQDAATGNVIGIGVDEKIESLNLQNLDGAYGMARENILKNIATAADMPARLLNNETMVSGLADGTEDAKATAQWVARFREELQPLYAYFDQIVQYRAWNPEWYKTIQAEFADEYGEMEYKAAFYKWRNSFTATWPSLLVEPESELAKAEDVKLKAIISFVEVLLPVLDPMNKATAIGWAADNVNSMKTMFSVPLVLDQEAIAAYEPPAAELDTLKEPHEPKPFAAQDAEPAVTRLRALVRT